VESITPTYNGNFLKENVFRELIEHREAVEELKVTESNFGIRNSQILRKVLDNPARV
jgi:hypothetical protein